MGNFGLLMGRFCLDSVWSGSTFFSFQQKKVVEAAGVEPASLTNLPAATTCLVRRIFSAGRLRPDTDSPSLVRRDKSQFNARRLRAELNLLWRSSGVAGVHRRTSWQLR